MVKKNIVVVVWSNGIEAYRSYRKSKTLNLMVCQILIQQKKVTFLKE